MIADGGGPHPDSAKRCRVHDLALGPEGACVVCRRSDPPPRVLRASPWVLAAGVAVLALGGAALRHRRHPQRPLPVVAAHDHLPVVEAPLEPRPVDEARTVAHAGGALVVPPPLPPAGPPVEAPAATGSLPDPSADTDDDDPGIVVGEREPENPAMWNEAGGWATGGVILRQRRAAPASTVILVYDSVREIPPPRPMEGVSGTRGAARPRRAGRW